MDITKDQITFHIVDDLQNCQQLWEQFSPKITIYDDWYFRYLFHTYHQHTLHWITAHHKQQIVGVLPLQYNTHTNTYEFWGGDYMEDNRAFVLLGYESILPSLYAAAPAPQKLDYITGIDTYTTTLPIQDYKYVIESTHINSFDEYLTNHFDADTRGKFRRKIRHIEKMHVVLHTARPQDMDTLISYNLARFGEHSSFADRPHHKEIFNDLSSGIIGEPILIGFEIDGQIVAASFAILYNGVYEYFNLGVAANAHKDITTFVHYTNIRVAIEKKAILFDAFVGSYGWKELWHMKKIPQYIYKKTT